MTNQEKQIMQLLLYLRRHIGMKVTHQQIKDTFGSVQIKVAFSHLYHLGYLRQEKRGFWIVKENISNNLETILLEVKRYNNHNHNHNHNHDQRQPITRNATKAKDPKGK